MECTGVTPGADIHGEEALTSFAITSFDVYTKIVLFSRFFAQ